MYRTHRGSWTALSPTDTLALSCCPDLRANTIRAVNGLLSCFTCFLVTYTSLSFQPQFSSLARFLLYRLTLRTCSQFYALDLQHVYELLIKNVYPISHCILLYLSVYKENKEELVKMPKCGRRQRTQPGWLSLPTLMPQKIVLSSAYGINNKMNK